MVIKIWVSTNRKLVKEFNRQIPKNQIAYQEFLDALELAAADYAEIAMPNRQNWTQPEEEVVYQSLKALDVFGVKQTRSFLLALFDVKRRNLVSYKEYRRIMEYLEYFHFVFNAVCSVRPSGLERRYSSYARKLRDSKNKPETAGCIGELINAMQATLPTYEEFERNFLEINYTSKNTKNKYLVQYILKKMETYLSGSSELVLSSFSIEHIFPESTQNTCAGRMGNLLPLGVELNSILADKSFKLKVEGYSKSQYVSVQSFIKKYGELDEWKEDNIEHRTKEIAKIMYTQNGLR